MALPVVDSGIGLREVDPVALVDASGSLYSVRSQYAVVDVDLTVPTSGLAAGDVMADTQVISNIASEVDKSVLLLSATLIDPAHTLDGFDLVFLSDNLSLGAENAAPTISDVNVLAVLASGRW
jgi:hypothetical protein